MFRIAFFRNKKRVRKAFLHKLWSKRFEKLLVFIDYSKYLSRHRNGDSLSAIHD